MTQLYTDKSNARRAARKALGAETLFRIVPVGEKFTFEALSDDPADMPASRFETQAEPIHAQPPGFARLRASEGAEELRTRTVIEQERERKEAAERIAAQKAAPVLLGKVIELRPVAPAKAEAPAKAAKTAPKEGTRSRQIFDMLARPEGATAKEMAAAGLKDISCMSSAKEFAARYGHQVKAKKENAFDRVFLIVAKESAAA